MSHLLSKARRGGRRRRNPAVLGCQANAATDVRVGFIPVVGAGQLFVIDGEGWARDAGLNLKLTQFDPGRR